MTDIKPTYELMLILRNELIEDIEKLQNPSFLDYYAKGMSYINLLKLHFANDV